MVKHKTINMKKRATIALMGIGILFMTSCKKDWNCVCNNVPILGAVTTEHEEMTRIEATEECDATEESYHENSLTGVSCSLSAQ